MHFGDLVEYSLKHYVFSDIRKGIGSFYNKIFKVVLKITYLFLDKFANKDFFIKMLIFPMLHIYSHIFVHSIF